MTLKEQILIFWDAENFNYEKRINISKYVGEHQKSIWFVIMMNMWITTDSTCCLNGWEL